MHVEVRFRSLEPSESLRSHASARVRAHLARFGDELVGVVVRIADVNGPRGGLDKQCRVTVRGRRFPPTVLEELSIDPYAAVSAAVERIEGAVTRALGRSQRRRPRARALARPTASRALPLAPEVH
ncbi:MAG: HPF/RaiA family ribosome-associated protein [Polyangiaceae bacterium]